MSFICPDCGFVSHNPNDVINKYCGNCHEFKQVNVNKEPLNVPMQRNMDKKEPNKES